MMLHPRLAALAVALGLASTGGCSPDADRPLAAGELPPSTRVRVSVPAGATADDLEPIVARGIESRGGKEDSCRFVVIRAGDRHGSSFRERAFHVLVGAGVTLPDGSMRIRREWTTSGMVLGRNEEPERTGIAVCVEPDAPRPFSPAVKRAVAEFCEALARRAPLHPDLVLAMEEIPNTRPHEADGAERELAAAARAAVPVPPAPYELTIVSADGERFRISYELADTEQSRSIGMMLRDGFDGPDRGMLFEYPHRKQCHFYMRNVLIPIDLAYIREGTIEDLFTMEPQAGLSRQDVKWYNSSTAVRFALELPGGWFERHGIEEGDRVEFHPR